MSQHDIGIRCDYFLPMASANKTEVLRDIYLGVSGNRIIEITPWEKIKNPKPAKKLIHAREQVVLPGLINGHTHLAMTLLRGVADDLPFHEWLYDYILPLESKLVDRDFVETGVSLAALECIRSGVTTVCDMYFFADHVARTWDHAGLRGIIAEAVTDFPGPDDPDGTGNSYRILDEITAKYKNHSRLTPAIGPHAPYTCGDETLKKAKAYAVSHGLPLAIHVSETEAEVKESIQKFGKTPVQRLHDLGVMNNKDTAGTIFAHGIHLDSDDIKLMAQTKTGVVYNPESNLKLGAGLAPIRDYLKAGVAIAIGTDGAASNNNLNLFGEMDLGAKIQKLKSSDGTVGAAEMLTMATIGGARALGLEKEVGSLEVGKRADIICVDLSAPQMRPLYNVASQLVYAANGSEVKTVICDGAFVMEEGKILTIDEKSVFEKVETFRKKIAALVIAGKKA